MYPPKGYFTKLLEAAFLFAISAWLVRAGIILLEDVWEWLVILAAVIVVLIVIWRIVRHHRDTHF